MIFKLKKLSPLKAPQPQLWTRHYALFGCAFSDKKNKIKKALEKVQMWDSGASEKIPFLHHGKAVPSNFTIKKSFYIFIYKQ